jgi:DsbC/DsbD-like thiol-disulfide interchange protein
MVRAMARQDLAGKPRRTLSWAAVVAFAILSFAAGVQAQSNPAQHARIELIADVGELAGAQPLWVGLLFHLDKGWHVYWQNPGDSGESPRIEWKLPERLLAGAVEWPRPLRLGSGTIVDYGYEDQVLLMAPFHAAPGMSPISNATIAADVKYIVCREICVPGKTSLSLTMPLSAEQSVHVAEWHRIFERTRRQLPQSAPSTWKISAVSDKDRFLLTIRGSHDHHVTFFPLEPSVIDNAAPQKLVFTADGLEMSLQKSDQLLKPLPVLRGVIVVEGSEVFHLAVPISRRFR